MSQGQLVTLSEHELSIDELTTQVNKIQQIMESVMIVDTHYGTIPGTTKPTLYKAGAEKLNLVFRLSPAYEMEKIEHDGGHREYNFICRLTHLPTGLMFAEGYGSCSTLESKYRYRWDDTDIEVPKEYWETRDISLLGGSAFTARKTWINKKQVWHIFQKIEISDPADYYNTCLKIGKKRALIDATLTATAASDIFTQDLDDNPNIPADEYVQDYPNGKKNAKPDVKSPEQKDKNKDLINAICDEVMKLAENDIEKAPPILLKFTTFEGKNGEVINGTSDTADLYNYSAKRLGVLHGKLKKEIEKKGNSIGDENAKPPNE